MRKYLRTIGFISTLSLALSMATAGVHAAQEIVLVSDQSQIIKLPAPPATVLIGNPSIADATTEGSSLFLHPRGFGLTNIVALDEKGNKLGDYKVRVIFEDSYSVAIYGPNGRETYSCRKDCETTLRIGDENTYFTNYRSQAGAKNALAYTQAFGEELLAPANTTGPMTIFTFPTQ